VTFPHRIHHRVAADPCDKPGLAYLTAQMIADGGTKDLTYKQIGDALFPMASSVNAQVDKEMCTFGGATHVDNLDAYYKLLRGMLLTARLARRRFPPRQGRRHQRHQGTAARQQRRGVRQRKYSTKRLYQGTPYGHLNTGTISSLEKITLDDVKAFYKRPVQPVAAHYRNRGRLFSGFLTAMKKDFQALPATADPQPRISRRPRSKNRAPSSWTKTRAASPSRSAIRSM
jgi:zinc protease